MSNYKNKLYPSLEEMQPTSRRPLYPNDYRTNKDEDSEVSDVSPEEEESENETYNALSPASSEVKPESDISENENNQRTKDFSVSPKYPSLSKSEFTYRGNTNHLRKEYHGRRPTRNVTLQYECVQHPQEDNKKNGNNYILSGIIFLAIITILLGVILNCNLIQQKTAPSQADSNLANIIREKIASLKDDFPLQPEDTWFELDSAITTFFEKAHSISLILRYENDINIKTPKCLVNKLLTALDLNSILVERNYKKGELIDKLKNRSNISLIIENLQDFPISMVEDFHFLCDPETKMGNTFMCLFILKVKKNNVENSFRNTERILTDLWVDSLGPEKTAALITRLNSNNVDFRNENKLPYDC